MAGNRNGFHIHCLALGIAMSSCCGVPVLAAPAGSPSQLDLLRLQQQQAAYWQNGSANNQNYGVVTSTIERIESTLNNAQKTLSDSDYYEFQNKLYTLKQNASLELSRGSDASSQVSPAQSLESDLSNRIRESSQQTGGKKSTLENLAIRLEATLNSKAERLSADDLDILRRELADFKARSALPAAYSDELQFNKLIREGNELELAIRNKSMFTIGHGHLTFTKDENVDSKNKLEVKKEEPLPSTSPPGQKPGTQIREPKKPPVPIHKLIDIIENELMEFHDKRQLGSFDIDSFSEKLLGIKRNLQVMMGKTGRLSFRQESVVREELETLRQEISDRVLGKN